jgi:N-acetylglucosamine-6-phosphate deacetylase
MPLAGTADGEAEWEGERIRVEGGKAVRADGTIVGGVTTLDAMVRNAVENMQMTRADALSMASAVPARAVRLGASYGSLEPERAADFVLLDDELRVVETWVAGARVYRDDAT